MQASRIGILQRIGNTSLIPLRRLVPSGCTRVFLKMESESPTGSVKDRMAIEMTIRLAREEGLFGGMSTGSNVVAALRLAEHLGPGGTVATVLCDAGMKSLGKFRRELEARYLA